MWRGPSGSIVIYGHTVDGFYWLHFPGQASFRFGGGSDEVTVVAAPTVSPSFVRNAFCRNVLPIALQALGHEVLHASAVQAAGGVIALCAHSQTGKSTIAYALSRRGYGLCADDALAFEIQDRGVACLPLPFRLRLRPPAASFFGFRAATGRRSVCWEDTNLCRVAPVPLVALCVLGQSVATTPDAPVKVSWLSPSAAFTAVLAHAHCFQLGEEERKRRLMQQYLGLVAQAPTLAVHFRPGLENLPAILDAIEEAIFSLPASVVHEGAPASH